MNTKETIQTYFDAIHKGNWQSLMVDDFIFINSNLDNIEYGKAAYVEGAGRFFQATTSVEIKQIIIEDNKAAIVARYQLRSPKGNTGVCDVAEIISVKDEKIASSAIFFDTKAFQGFMAN